jgi:hypothetical protein
MIEGKLALATTKFRVTELLKLNTRKKCKLFTTDISAGDTFSVEMNSRLQWGN